jgi:hypothetical protein
MDPILGPNYEPGLIDSRGRLTRFCKGAKAPQQTSQQKRNERLQESLLKKQLKQSTEFEFPEMPAPLPVLPAPPPPTATSADTIEAGRYARKQAGKRTNTGTGTIFAGNTGGYKPAGLGGQKTLLG